MCFPAIILSTLIPLAPSKLFLLILDFSYTFAVCAFMPLIDNWVVSETADDKKISYGSLRLWGSIGFAITAAVYGHFSMSIDVGFIFYGRAFFFLLLLILFFSNNTETSLLPGTAKKENPEIKALFAKKEYWLFFVFLFIFFLPVNAAGSFFPRLLLEMGSDNQTIAMFNAINAIVEIPFFLYVRKLTHKIGPRGLMLTGGLFMILRLFGFASASSIPLILASHLCVAPYITLFMPGFIFYSHSIAPNNTRAFTLTSLQGFAMGLAGMIGSYSAGIIVDSSGIRSLYFLGFALCLAAMVLFIFSSFWLKEKRAN